LKSETHPGKTGGERRKNSQLTPESLVNKKGGGDVNDQEVKKKNVRGRGKRHIRGEGEEGAGNGRLAQRASPRKNTVRGNAGVRAKPRRTCRGTGCFNWHRRRGKDFSGWGNTAPGRKRRKTPKGGEGAV